MQDQINTTTVASRIRDILTKFKVDTFSEEEAQTALLSLIQSSDGGATEDVLGLRHHD